MRNFKKRLSIFILLLISHTLINAEVIKVPPIVIDNKEKNSVDETITILSNLKKAITQNKKFNKPSKEEEAKEILKILKKSIYRQHNLSSQKTRKVITSIQDSIVKKKITKKTKIEKISKVKISKKLIKSKHIKEKFTKKRDKVVVLKDKKPSSPSSTEPIGFVKTLGVVGKPKVYEANDLVIDKREEIANDGVVYIPTATTDELLKELPFVKSIEVVKVTQPFEASEAKKYQLDKR